MNTKHLFIVATFIGFAQSLNAQQLINAQSGSISNDQFQMDWSLGQVSNQSYVCDRLIFQEGILTPFLESKIKEPHSLFEIELYPNPTSDYLFVNTKIEVSAYSIYDLSGSLIKRNNAISNPYSQMISVSTLPKGMYVIQFEINTEHQEARKFIKK